MAGPVLDVGQPTGCGDTRFDRLFLVTAVDQPVLAVFLGVHQHAQESGGGFALLVVGVAARQEVDLEGVAAELVGGAADAGRVDGRHFWLGLGLSVSRDGRIKRDPFLVGGAVPVADRRFLLVVPLLRRQ